MRDRLRPAVLARKVLLPPVLAGAAASCLLGALALTIGKDSRADAPDPLASTPVQREEELTIGLSLELGGTARLDTTDQPASQPPSGALTGAGARGRATATLAVPVAGVVGGCGTFGCPRPGHLHNGVDFLAAAGTPVHAAASGRVALVQSPSQSAGYGNFVCLQHRPGLATCYAHLSAVAARVAPGARVQRGQVVGLVGATGSASAPHLHFEVRRGPATCQRCAVDPLALLPRAAGASPPAEVASGAAKVAAVPPPAAAPPPAVVGTVPGPHAPTSPPDAPEPRQDEPTPESSMTVEQAKPEHVRLPPDPVQEPPAAGQSSPAPAIDPAAPPPAAAPATAQPG